jgi:hypothetical protein
VGYRLVNLGDSDVFVGPTGEQSLTPRFSTDLVDGMQIKVGDFNLIFRGEGSVGSATQPGGISRQSQHLGLRFSLPQRHIAPHHTLEGVITVSNLGDHPAAQIELELEGLADDYFELEPGPLLSPGAEQEVFFLLYHRGAKPLAGPYRLTISAAAPRAYPAEQISLAQVVSFLPLYEHTLTLRPVGGKSQPKKSTKVINNPVSQPPAKEREFGSVWNEPSPPPPAPTILVEPPASPPPQPEPLPLVVAEPLTVEPSPTIEPEPSISPVGEPPAPPLAVKPSEPAGEPQAEADWWTTPEATSTRPTLRPAMKLKATAETPEKTPPGDQPAATGDDWWTSPPESAPPAESPEQQTIKAKKQD